MLDSLIRARDTFLKPTTGLMMPSHATMLLAPIVDEEERKVQHTDYAAAMDDWKEFAETTQTMYGVDMTVLQEDFDREQKEYYVLSSRWAELGTGCLLAEPCVVKEYDMHVCTVEDARGVGLALGQDEGQGAPFDFDIVGRSTSNMHGMDDGSVVNDAGVAGPISGFAGWFTVDFKSRTDEVGRGVAPEVPNPAYLSTGPEMGCECSSLYYVCHLLFVSLILKCLTLLINQSMYILLSILCSNAYNRHPLGTTGISSTKRNPTPCRSNHSYQWYYGDDAYEGKCKVVQCSLPVHYLT